jgi:hypothetical protein
MLMSVRFFSSSFEGVETRKVYPTFSMRSINSYISGQTIRNTVEQRQTSISRAVTPVKRALQRSNVAVCTLELNAHSSLLR